MGVTMVLFWALVLAGVAVLVRMLVRGRAAHHAAHHDGPHPERVLAERFARGEIDEREYRRGLEVLHDRSRGDG